MSEHLVGLISDTHGLLRPEALAALHGCELILHAGDVGANDVLEGLREIAPVIAVRGNVDTGPFDERLLLHQTATVGDVRIAILHRLADLDFDPGKAGFRVLVSGHSHQPLIQPKGNVLYVNPGSAGPRRFRQQVTVGLLRVDGAGVRAEIVKLEAG